ALKLASYLSVSTELAESAIAPFASQEADSERAGLSEREPWRLSPQAADLLVGILPLDVPALERNAQRFFARIEKLSEQCSDPTTLVTWTSSAAAGLVMVW